VSFLPFLTFFKINFILWMIFEWFKSLWRNGFIIKKIFDECTTMILFIFLLNFSLLIQILSEKFIKSIIDMSLDYSSLKIISLAGI
jgi:hypothetical protein